MPMQITVIFQGSKNDDFQIETYDIFLIFAQNIDGEAVVMSTHNLCFRTKIRKMHTPVNPSFII